MLDTTPSPSRQLGIRRQLAFPSHYHSNSSAALGPWCWWDPPQDMDRGIKSYWWHWGQWFPADILPLRWSGPSRLPGAGSQGNPAFLTHPP